MKCTNKIIGTLLSATIFCSVLSGCSGNNYAMAYSRNPSSTAYQIDSVVSESSVLDPFATDLCVTSGNIIDGTNISLSESSYAAGLFDLSQKEVLYAQNIHEQLAPASLTKVMTALVALKYGNIDDKITVSANCKITESGAQLYGFKEGDVITLYQALNALLLYSANDAALIIAEYISGSTEEFAKLMNEEALRIGATHSHFVNPHGLSAEEHYTTVYDLYLIFNEAVKYEKFCEIIQMSSYNSVYYDKDGNSVNIKFETTNQYLKGNYEVPQNITIIGGKTGTTNAAGNCLIMYAKDSAGNPYISIILRADTRDELYGDMSKLLSSVSN